MANPPIFDFDYLDSRAFRSVEIPAANGVTTARSLSRIYAACSLGGSLDGVRLLGRDTLDEATRVHVSGVDEVYRVPTAWALGFFNPSPGNEFSPNASAFGHAGIGGSIGFADPVALGRVRLRDEPPRDPQPHRPPPACPRGGAVRRPVAGSSLPRRAVHSISLSTSSLYIP